MRLHAALLICLASPALAQDVEGAPPSPPQPRRALAGPAPAPFPGPGGAPQRPVYPPGFGMGGCYNCGGYSGSYYGSNVVVRPPAPPPRIQGQWKNGWWYY